jgi:L-asparaginase II
MRLQVDVVVWRGSIGESRHRVQAAVSDPAGRLRAATEEAGLTTTFRSAAKPFQLLPLVERGHADRWGCSEEELAVMAASHTGSADHVRLVAGILDRLGLTDRHLACGYHEPLDPGSRERLASGEVPPSPLYNNCSGKHAGMLCLALSEGWPVEGYETADHPVQRLMHRTVAELCGLRAEEVAVAVDGCSVSVFAVPLTAMARSYAWLAAAGPEGDTRARALHRIRSAMQSFPRAVAGEGRLSTELMTATGSRMVAKGGAEGLECVGLPDKRLGIALKCEDGQARALGPAVVRLLEHLGELSGDEAARLDAWREPVVRNHAGLEVGRIAARVTSLSPAAP